MNRSTQNVQLTGWRFRWYQARMLMRAVRIAWQVYPGLGDATRALSGLLQKNLLNSRYRHVRKAVVVDGRVFSMMSVSGFPSAGLDTMLRNELHRAVPIPGFTRGLLLLLLAVTRKCPLHCVHCFEGEVLNQRDVLSADDLLAIIGKFQAHGLANVELGGGEPLNRFATLLEVLQRADTARTDFWISTSGYQLDAVRARQLKAAGLTGVSVSIDHWDAAAHDRFRGHPGAFERAVRAVGHARAVGLAVGMTLVPTRDFCRPDDLWRYLDLARALGAHVVRILEPRAVGNYALVPGPVELGPHEWAVLEDFHRTVQTTRAGRGYPLLEYHGAFNRQVGCGGAGERYLYVDTNGDMHACPMCRHACGSAVTGSIEAGLAAMKRAGGCHAYHAV